ncbi:MAG: hypothetical protein Q9167_004792 [Letrouitia subvulpina]
MHNHKRRVNDDSSFQPFNSNKEYHFRDMDSIASSDDDDFHPFINANEKFCFRDIDSMPTYDDNSFKPFINANKQFCFRDIDSIATYDDESFKPFINANEQFCFRDIDAKATINTVSETQSVDAEATINTILETESVDAEATVYTVSETESVDAEDTLNTISETESVDAEATVNTVSETESVDAEDTINTISETESLDAEATVNTVTETQNVDAEATVNTVPETESLLEKTIQEIDNLIGSYSCDSVSDAVSDSGTVIHHPLSPDFTKPWKYDIIAPRNLSTPHLEKHFGRHLYKTEPDFVRQGLRCANSFDSLRSDCSSLDYAAWNLYKDASKITLEQLAFADLDTEVSNHDTQPPTLQIKLAAWLLWEDAAEITLDRLITSLRNPIGHLLDDRTFTHNLDNLEAQTPGWRTAVDILAKDCKTYTLAHFLKALRECIPRCILYNSDSRQQLPNGDHCPYIDCRSRIRTNIYRKPARAEENSDLLRSHAAIRRSLFSETSAAKCTHHRWFLDARGSQITIEQLCHAQARYWQVHWARSKYEDRPATPAGYYGEVFRVVPRGKFIDTNIPNFDTTAGAAANHNQVASDASVNRPLPATPSSRDRGLHLEEVAPLRIGKPPTELRHPSPQKSAKAFLKYWEEVDRD